MAKPTPPALTTADYLKVESRLSTDEKAVLAAGIAAEMNTDDGDPYTFAEAEAILRLIIWDGEPRVIVSIAQAAAGNPHTPRSLAWALANDDEAAAIPILEVSGSLTDADLMAIIEGTGNFPKMGAIARRPSVGKEVSRSLVKHGDENAVHLLLTNVKADIPDDALVGMRDRLKDSERIREGIALRNQAATATIPLGIPDDLSDADQSELIAEMIAENSLTAHFMVRKLCYGHFGFFCRALAAMTKVSQSDVAARVVVAPSIHLAEFWKRASLSPEWLPVASAALVALIDIDRSYIKSDPQVFRKNVVDRTLADLKADGYVLSAVQRDFFRSLQG